MCIAGATSTVARYVADRLASQGARLHLAARNKEEAKRIGRDLRVRHEAHLSWSHFEATDPDARAALLKKASAEMGGLDLLFVAVGMLGDQAKAETDPDYLQKVIEVNFTAVAQLLTIAAQQFEAQGSGVIVALSSVAGDRGRPGNYAYGASKAGLTAFLEGMRSRLYGSGVHVLTVNPGPTDTKMTFGMDNPPPIWRYIMTAIRLIPASMFKKLSL